MGTPCRPPIAAIATLAICFSVACKSPAREPDTGHRFDALFAGCALVRIGPLCELEVDRHVRLWIPIDALRPEFQTDQGSPVVATAVVTTSRPSDGGTLYELTVPKHASHVRVVASVNHTRSTFTLAVGTLVQPEPLRLAAILRRTDPDKALAGLKAAWPSLSAQFQGRVLAMQGRIALQKGQVDAAVSDLRASSAAAVQTGRVSDAVDDSLALTHALVAYQQNFVEARQVLTRARAWAAAYPQGLAQLPRFEGLLAENLGDFRDALARYREAAQLAGRLGLRDAERSAREATADLLAWMGRFRQARAIAADLSSGVAGDQPCFRADVYTNAAWIEVLSLRGAGTPLFEIRKADDLLRQAAEQLQACPDPFRQRNALINELMFAIGRGDVSLAASKVSALSALQGGRSAASRVWELEMQGRLALVQGQASQAADHFDTEIRLATAAGFREAAFRAQVGRGQALRAQGRWQPAAAALQVAESQLDQLLGEVPFGEGRDVFVGRHDEGARALVDALVSMGRNGHAVRVARMARARALRTTAEASHLGQLSPEERAAWEAALSRYRRSRAQIEAEAADDWKLSLADLTATRIRREAGELAMRNILDDAYRALAGGAIEKPVLRMPGVGELFLVYFPTDRGWTGFALSASATTALHLGTVDPNAPAALLGTQLLAPFTREIARAHNIIVYAYGALQAVDVHALPFQNLPLIAHAPVAYGLDVPAAPRRPAAPDAIGGNIPVKNRNSRAPLIVANPTGDLLSAEEEGRAVQASLAVEGTILLTRDSATRSRVLELLPQSALFHYAGHGAAAGLDGTGSLLLLAGGQRILLGDILTLSAVPQLVVLSGCETARGTDDDNEGGGTAAMGLAQAFLAAGSSGVIATSRPIADRTARATMVAFFREWSARPTLDPAKALRLAQMEMYRLADASDWASLRVLLP